MPDVNLDAMIHRDDFDTSSTSEQKMRSGSATLRLVDLADNSLVFPTLRKPDFQRETNEWNSEKVCKLIESFVDDELIPAVIFWNASSSYTFVIDGAHRLSALASWVNDDYGDGEISKKFYDKIENEQLSAAEKTRILVRKRIGPYSDYLLAVTNPDKVSGKIVERSKNLGLLSLSIQWVGGDQKHAESSFFKINQQGEPLSKTEMKLLKERKKPHVLAARAIIKGGQGHPYWGKFEDGKQEQIKKISEKLFCNLFRPPLNKPVKTLDKLPLAGKVGLASTLPTISSFVNIVNDLGNRDIHDDNSGDMTIEYLNNCNVLTNRISSNEPFSLGLHPAIYFYSHDGRHKQASFYAAVNFVKQLDTKNKIYDFLNVRGKFEIILQKYNYLIQQILRNYRSADKAYPHITEYYHKIIKKLNEGKDVDNVIDEIMKDSFDFLTIRQVGSHGEIDSFSQNTKSSIFIKTALENAIKCNICGGLVPTNSISFDHIIRKQDGGLNTDDNGQITHPYCNTSFKN